MSGKYLDHFNQRKISLLGRTPEKPQDNSFKTLQDRLWLSSSQFPASGKVRGLRWQKGDANSSQSGLWRLRDVTGARIDP